MKNQRSILGLLYFFPVLLISTSCSKDSINNLPCGAETIKIGVQSWCTKNLDVSTYRNGDTIPEVQDSTKWEQITYGAWCYYNNDSTNEKIYGKLYNWYAIIDPRKLAPNGFHIPSDAEWSTLVSSLGGASVAGGNMKEIGTAHWLSPNTDASNRSCFTGLPGGYRFALNLFYDIGATGYWWSTTEDTGNGAIWDYSLFYYTGGIGRYDVSKQSGLSVRCVVGN